MMETLPSEADMQRDAVEIQLAQEAKKPEIHYERRHGLEIRVYYLREAGRLSMSLTESERTREFEIPTDSALDAINHPEIYAYQAGMPRPRNEE